MKRTLLKSIAKSGLVVFTLSLLILSSCNRNQEKIKSENYVLTIEKLDTLTVQKIVDEEGDEKSFLRRVFGSPAEKNWLKIHRQCMANQITKRTVFLGVTNKLGIGTIFQKGFVSTRDEITNDNFTESEMSELINKGASGTCDFQQQVSVNADVLLDVNSSTFSSIDGDLGLAISNQKSINATIEGYQINHLYTGRLLKLLERTTEQGKLDYLDWLTEEGNLLVTSVIEINGFSMIIELKNSIGADLKAKLDEGITGKLGNTDINVRFKYESETKIKMVSENDFYIFGEVVKIKKVRKN